MRNIRIKPSRIAAFGLLVVLLTVANIVHLPDDAYGASSAISIDSPSDGAVVTAGTVRVSGIFAGLYDIKLVINGAKQADVVTVYPDGDQSGTWYYD